MDQEKLRARSFDYLSEALTEIMQKKSVHSVKVSELCQQAQINRSTFYRQFLDMQDFLDHLIDYYAKGLIAYCLGRCRPSDMLLPQKAQVLYTRWFEYVKEHHQFFRTIMGPNGTPAFENKLINNGVIWYSELLAPYADKLKEHTTPEILAHYLISAHLGMMQYHLQSGMKYSCEFMAQQLQTLTFDGILAQFQICAGPGLGEQNK